MTQPTLKSELLKQNDHTALDMEVANLRRLVEGEQRRARRLTFWTLAVWIIWILMLALGLGLPYVQARSNAPHHASPTTMPVDQPSPAEFQQRSQTSHSSAPGALFAAIGVLLVVLFLVMPFVGIVLTIMMILARRSASLGQIRASLASIDVQLRLALAAQQPPAAGPKA